MFESSNQELLIKKNLPAYRKLRAYAFDPSLSVNLETAGINEIVYKIPWEELWDDELQDQHDKNRLSFPVGEYLEIIDYDPSSDSFYQPIHLNDPFVLAQDGLTPSEGNPQFHQQMVYAVCMTTIRNFERALGRWIFWSPRYVDIPPPDIDPLLTATENPPPPKKDELFVQRLRIYPHALRAANAYYSPDKKALLFGYFPAFGKGTAQFPGGLVFTCLSHDVIAHETTHALLDGLHRRYIEPTNPDCHAFHEAFSDIVALFQHFTFPEVLYHQIAKTRGDLASQNLLGELAQQFGESIGHYGALRSALGKKDEKGVWHAAVPDPIAYQTVMTPHERGSLLVGAIFDAFLAIYKSRVEDLLRIATNGTGVLPEGALHPDLIKRLANEASKAASHVLNMCVRALDYCPPLDITFGEYLRALITADYDIVSDDERGYRIAFTEAFRKRGIFPAGIRTLSPDSLRWPEIHTDITSNYSFSLLAEYLRKEVDRTKYLATREASFKESKRIRASLHKRIWENFDESEEFKKITGLVLLNDKAIWPGDGKPVFEVHSFRSAQRIGPSGQSLNQAIITIMQKRILPRKNGNPFTFRGGCTMIFDLNDMRLRFCVSKGINDNARMKYQEKYMFSKLDQTLRATFFGDSTEEKEKFAMLHTL